jgi:hypothetical protein
VETRLREPLPTSEHAIVRDKIDSVDGDQWRSQQIARDSRKRYLAIGVDVARAKHLTKANKI